MLKGPIVKPKCESCRFAQRVGSNADVFSCRREEPQLIRVTATLTKPLWPAVKRASLCPAHEEKSN